MLVTDQTDYPRGYLALYSPETDAADYIVVSPDAHPLWVDAHQVMGLSTQHKNEESILRSEAKYHRVQLSDTVREQALNLWSYLSVID